MKKLLFLCLILLASFITYSQITFERILSDGEASQIGEKIIQTYDNGYAIIAWHSSFYPEDESDLLVIKTDEFGDTMWTNNIDDNSNYKLTPSDIQETSDSGFIIVGTKSFEISPSLDSSLVYLSKLTKDGVQLWSKTYSYIKAGHPDDWYIKNTGSAVRETFDSGFIVIGGADILGTSDQAYLIKTDNSGEVVWEKSFVFLRNVETYELCLTDEGGYLFGGWYNYLSASPTVAYLMKVNETGDSLWRRSFIPPAYNSVVSIQNVGENKFMVGVGFHNWMTGDKNTQAHLLTGENDLLSSNTFELGDVRCTDLHQLDEENYIIGGTIRDTNDISYMYLCKVDSGKVIKWEKEFGGVLYEGCRSMIKTNDGGYALLGYTSEMPYENQKIYLIKTDENGGMTWVKEYNLKNQIEAYCFPNPFTTSTTITYELHNAAKVQITIFNHLGMQVDFIRKNQSQGKQQIIWDATGLTSGVYYFRLQAGEKIATGKLLLVR